ncbi:MAG: ABC transporter substrate-binding protein [Actinomycetota bacterium]
MLYKRMAGRFGLTLAALVIVVLPACSADDETTTESQAAPATEEPAAPDDEVPADADASDDEGPADADGSDDAAGGDRQTGDGATRTVDHALGTSEVPVEPRRIVSLDSIQTLDSIVALGAEDRLVGRINLSGSDDPFWLDVDIDAVPLLGTWPNLSIEEILAADPDLVVGYQNAAEALGPAAGDAVPVVAVAPTAGVTNPRWQDVLRGVGAAIDEAAAADALIADYDARLDEVVAGLPDDFAGRNVLVLLGQGGVTGFAMGPSATPAEVFDRVGLEVSPSLDGQGDFVQLSEEIVPDLPADVALMLDFDGGATDWNAVLADQPAYAANPAIGDGVVVVDGSLWLNAGPLGQLLLLDELVEVLAP